jgi:hypothetical protein
MYVKSGIFETNFEKPTKNWPKDTVAQCGGSEIDGIGKNCFFEVFFKDFYVRGEGPTKIEAENNAWNKYMAYESCEHDFKRHSDSQDKGKCTKCGILKSGIFEIITCCTVCNKKSVTHYSNGIGFTCYKHYKENLVKMTQNADFGLAHKLLWENTILEELEIFKDKNDVEIDKLSSSHRNGFFEYMIQVCGLMKEQHCPNNKKHYVDIFEDIEKNETIYKIAFMIYIHDNKKVIVNNIDKHKDSLVDFFKNNS